MNFRFVNSFCLFSELFRLKPAHKCFWKCRSFHRSSTLSIGKSQSSYVSRSNNQRSIECNKQAAIKGRRLLLRTPRGTFDRYPQQMAIQQNALYKIVNIFEKHGAETIDTPVFEYKDVLTEKYGEDSKLIYNLENEDGETLSMRYDLTVPLARYLAMHKKTGNLKRYHIAKVYRKDSPKIENGRYCEFLQCDFDIVGNHDPMIPDAECIKVIAEILDSLNVGDYVIKLNHRQILDGIFLACGVPNEKFRSICSAVDRLDKHSWCNIRQEMIEERGLEEKVADKIGEYVQLNGGPELIEKLLADEKLKVIPSVVNALDSMKTLLKYCGIFGLEDKINFDLSLARGLDYYTGSIIETVLKGTSTERRIGSIAAGGRYDNLIGMFDEKGKSIPCCGISIGIERILLILKEKYEKECVKFRTNKADVFIVTPHKGLGEERLKLVNRLWNAGIRCENSMRLSPKVLNQFEHCEEYGIPLGLIIGASELERGVVKIKEFATRQENDVAADDLVDEIIKRLEKYNADDIYEKAFFFETPSEKQ